MIPAEEQIFYRAVAARMKDERDELDWKQKKLAANSGIKSSKIHKIEGGVDRLRAYELFKICETLNVSADYLIGLDMNKRHREYPKIVLAIMEDLATIHNLQILESVYKFVRAVKNEIQSERETGKKLIGQ
ncbi:MAG: hypothetical protein DI551_08345 [Micavibrio aeruginosavorus]|uniref:HTH cro/C1-type domain-containing protein n=1 Tax=Micavibrio aeruginosavorus TaxID=349221 RepID=A0A2W5MWC7_9BACT|nr:MAG: hypothetical protein DI551_08345 [Micavibrio aeruginosavorus]